MLSAQANNFSKGGKKFANAPDRAGEFVCVCERERDKKLIATQAYLNLIGLLWVNDEI